MTSRSLLTSPLHARHLALGAKLADFGGWEMPIEYSGTVGEHAAVRGRVGVFDVSHLGKATVRGPGAAEFVNRAFRQHGWKASVADTLACAMLPAI